MSPTVSQMRAVPLQCPLLPCCQAIAWGRGWPLLSWEGPGCFTEPEGGGQEDPCHGGEGAWRRGHGEGKAMLAVVANEEL